MSHIITFVKKNTSAIIAILILLAALEVFLYINTSKRSDSPDIKNPQEILSELYRFEVKKDNLSQEEKDKYLKQFETVKIQLKDAEDSWEREGESVAPLLYWPLLSIGSIHRDIGDLEKAKNAYLFAHKVQPEAYPPLGNLGDLYFRYLQDYKEAEKWFLQAIEIEGAYTEQYYSELYEIYRFHYKDEKKAENFLLSGIEKYPEKLGILSDLALHYRMTGQKEKARDMYKKLLEKNPESMVAKQALEELKEK